MEDDQDEVSIFLFEISTLEKQANRNLFFFCRHRRLMLINI